MKKLTAQKVLPKVGYWAILRDMPPAYKGYPLHIGDRLKVIDLEGSNVWVRAPWGKISLNWERFAYVKPGDDKKMKSLGDMTAWGLKVWLGKFLSCDPNHIRLFGSRISGWYNSDSDLDVAIWAPKVSEEQKMFIETEQHLTMEIRYLPTLNLSWLRDAV